MTGNRAITNSPISPNTPMTIRTYNGMFAKITDAPHTDVTITSADILTGRRIPR